MTTTAERVEQRLHGELQAGEAVLAATQAQRRGLQTTLAGVSSGLLTAWIGTRLAQSGHRGESDALTALGLALVVLGVGVSVWSLVQGGRRRRAEPSSELPRHCLVALTTQRVWICRFRGGLVATPTELVLSVPLTDVADVSEAPPRGVVLTLRDGSSVSWDFLPKTVREGGPLVAELRRLVGGPHPDVSEGEVHA
jgi:hypothetical protein